MRLFNKLFKKMRRITAKQAVVAGVFTLALAGAVGFGLSQRNAAEASTTRDSSANAIMRDGALSAGEYIDKLQANAQPDLQNIARNFHPEFNLDPSEYGAFRSQAILGTAYKDGRVVVDGQTVMTDAWSIGRQQKSYAWKHDIAGAGSYWASRSQDVFRGNSIPALVFFNNKGEVEYVTLTACGNLMGGKKVKVSAECKSLEQKEIGLNKYEFTTNVAASSLAQVVKVEYFLNNTKIGESGDAASGYKFTYTIAESGTVTSKVHVKVPGRQTIVVTSSGCSKNVEFKQPFYECTQLDAVVVKEEEDSTTYRFAATTKQGNGATFKNADFIVNGDTAAEGVTTVDDQGRVYHELAVENGKQHTISAKVKFTVNGKEVVASDQNCKTTVNPPKPFYACDLLRATALDEDNLNFRFTVIASFGDGAELKDADFAAWKKSDADNKTVVKGVTQKDDEGNIYHEMEFDADGETRVVEATVNFDVRGNVKSVTCKAEVTPKEAPKCPLPGKEHLPPNSPECKEEPCPYPGKEDLPKDSDQCVEKEVLGKQTELPKTGAGSVFGLFASATGVGAAAHRLIIRRQK